MLLLRMPAMVGREHAPPKQIMLCLPSRWRLSLYWESKSGADSFELSRVIVLRTSLSAYCQARLATHTFWLTAIAALHPLRTMFVSSS